MKGRIVRPDSAVELSGIGEAGRVHIGMKSEKGYPQSIDWFRPTGPYAQIFTDALGAKPNTISIVFPSDNAELVCNERYTYRDDNGDVVAKGDGQTFEIWNGKGYTAYSVERYPDIMQQVASKQPNKRVKAGKDGWEIELTMRFIIPAVRGVMGVWTLNSKGSASSIPNVRNAYDAIQKMRGTVTTTVFDLSVKFAKSNKPDTNSRFPVLSLIANDRRIEEIKQMLQNGTTNLLLPESNK